MAEAWGVELKRWTPNSRRMMTLQLPPSSNWSQLESERFNFPQNFNSSIAECFPALFCASFSDCGIVDLCRRLAAQVPSFRRWVRFPSLARRTTGNAI
jgi:hypothetical protein